MTLKYSVAPNAYKNIKMLLITLIALNTEDRKGKVWDAQKNVDAKLLLPYSCFLGKQLVTTTGCFQLFSVVSGCFQFVF